MAKKVVGNVDQRVREVSISWKAATKVSSTVKAKAGMG